MNSQLQEQTRDLILAQIQRKRYEMPRKLHVSTRIYTLTIITLYWALETEVNKMNYA